MPHLLELKNISVKLGDKPIVNDVSLALETGTIGCLLGPSGCGKTTLLRAIAGFIPLSAGEVWIDSHCASNVATMTAVEHRQVGMVFQDYALFPHLSVAENIKFGLQHLNRQARQQRVEKLSALMDITSLLHSYPHQLSGGQQQRVAVARAIAPSPRILLLDEPFASLDVVLREQIAREIRQVLKQEGITTLLVSHNQYEAFAMADEIGVMHEGHLLQWSSGFRLYHEPVTPYIADFVGEGVFLKGVVSDSLCVETILGVLCGPQQHGFAINETVQVLLRPDDVVHDDDSPLTAEVIERIFRGANFLYVLRLADGSRLLSLVPSHHTHPVGSSIGIRIEPDHLVVFAEAGHG